MAIVLRGLRRSLTLLASRSIVQTEACLQTVLEPREAVLRTHTQKFGHHSSVVGLENSVISNGFYSVN